VNNSWTVECAPRSGGSEAPRRAAHVHRARSARARKAGATRRRRRSLFQRQRTRGAGRSCAQPAETMSGNAPRKERSTSGVSSGAQTQRRKGDGASALRDGVEAAPLLLVPRTPLTVGRLVRGTYSLALRRFKTHTRPVPFPLRRRVARDAAGVALFTWCVAPFSPAACGTARTGPRAAHSCGFSRAVRSPL
jgi:hypothetical protein